MINNKIITFFDDKLFLVSLPRIMVGVFLFFQVLGMLNYPGGTIWNEETTEYVFTKNYFSDLGRYQAHNGEPNYLSMIFFSLSLCLVSLTFILHYVSVLRFFQNDYKRYNNIIALVGTIFSFLGAICLIGTALTPSDLVLDPHVFYANNIFHSFLVTSLMYTIVIYRSELIQNKYAAGYAIFFLSILSYVIILHFGPGPRENQAALIFQVVAQKMIVVIFILSVVYQTFGLDKSFKGE
tara:strand:- start:145 stop:858 length:714 start_codon:yes stop_codon:yes gene_type:complete